jgi:hypothetical protein
MRSAHIRPRAILAGALSVIALATTEPVSAQNDIKVEANLSATRIGVGESTILQISIQTRGDGADLMDLPELPPGLEITGNQRFSQLQVAIPSGNSRLIREDLIIRAHVPGEYTIPSFTVRVTGKIYRTKPLVLYVEQSGRARTRSGPPDRDEVLLRAWLEPDTVYVGQQVLLNAEALFPRDLRQRQSRPATYEAPTPADFWIQDVPDAVASSIRSINGDVYETQTFRRAYFPLSPGTFVLPPARILYEIRRGFLYAPEGRELVSDSLRVVVRPVPEENQPSSFKGAVGRFTIAARLEPELVGVGEAATLTVEIEGTGNVKALPPPQLPTIPGVELFPPSEESRVNANGDRIGGTKRFSWVLIPQAPGRIELDGIDYAYFDPELQQFEIERSRPLETRVVPEREGVGADRRDSALHYIALQPGDERFGWVRSPIFAALQAVPLLALFAAVFLGRNGETARSRRTRRQLRNARESAFDALRVAATSAESDRVFYADFATSMRTALADMLEAPELRTASRESLTRRLLDRGVSESTATGIDGLFQRIDHARFARNPATPFERSAMVGDAKRIFDGIDRELSPARKQSGAAIALLLLCAAPLPARAQSIPHDFGTGITAFQQDRYEDAVAAFTQHLRAHPRDANGWYNLGNAYIRLDKRGHAVWAWLRALDIAPRHPGARHNLSAVGAHEAIAELPLAFSLSFDEAALALGILWWLGGLTLAGVIGARRRGGAIVVAAVGLAIASFVAVAALPPALTGATGVALEPKSPLLAGPTLKADQITTFADGAPVTILEKRGEWWRVRSTDGREGWVEAAMFAEI